MDIVELLDRKKFESKKMALDALKVHGFSPVAKSKRFISDLYGRISAELISLPSGKYMLKLIPNW